MGRGGIPRTRALVVDRRLDSEYSNISELKSLAQAAGYEVVASVEQVGAAHPRYHIGSGKAREIAELVSELDIEKVVFGNELKAVQAYNLAKLAGIEVIDRFQLILEIFVRRASTKEAKLQIDLARLRYELAHAREKVRLAKLGEQPGFHGLGKYEVDVYYETIQRQMKSTQEKLKRIRETRVLHRNRRRELDLPLVSLAGYTNSGKSTLFNSLTGENVKIGLGLFTTLSTTTRAVDLFGKKALLTDTVGFVSRLPLTLIEAFKSTLEETIFSDLILLVVDVSEPEPDMERKVLVCLDTIQEIGAGRIPMTIVLNKVDLVQDPALERKIKSIKSLGLTPISVSALHKTNLSSLKREMWKFLKDEVKSSFSLRVNAESMPLLSWVLNETTLHDVRYEGESFRVYFESSPQFADRVRSRVEKLGGIFERG